VSSEVEALDRIDRTDRERARLQLDAERLTAAQREAETEAQTRRADEVAAKAAYDALRTEERTSERRIDDLRDKRKSATRVLETGIGDAASAQRQLERCDALIDEAETQHLGLLDQLEASKRALDEATRRRTHAEVVAKTADTEMPPRIRDLSAQATKVAAAVEADLGTLPGDLRSRYLAQRERSRWAVARLRSGKCDTCSMTAAPQTVADIKRGKLLECHGCKRWLLLPPE
jgi:predicted  nucleic acid-binding Zn-ribbon protein